MKNKILASLLCVALGASCGGGGGSSSNGSKNFVGTWSGAIFQTNNDCPFKEQDRIDFTHTVQQDGTRIVINTNSTVLEGNTDAEGFTVGQIVATEPVGNNLVCRVTAAMKYSTSGDDTADVETRTRYQCVERSNGQPFVDCNVVHEGESKRIK